MEYYVPDFTSLQSFATHDEIHMWLNEWRHMVFMKKPSHVIQSWFENLKRVYGPRIDGHHSCIEAHALFIGEPGRLPLMGTLVGCDMYEMCSK